jgi:tetratricopeptide (TPR) repeat protein
MRQILVGLVAALLAHAGLGDGIELNSKGLESYRAGQYREAEAWYRQAIEAFAPDQQLARALAKENLGVALRSQGRLAEARELLEDSVKEVQDIAGVDSLESAQAMSNLAAAYWSGSELSKAAELAARAEAIYAASPQARVFERANNRQILASVYLGQRRYRDAVNLLRDSLEFGGDRMKMTSYGNLAAASIGLSEMAEAEAYARRGVELADRALPEGHPYRAILLNNLAQAYRFNGKYMEAEKCYREALQVWEKRLGPDHPDVGRGLMNLAAFYHERGREAGAEQLYLRAAAILEQTEPVLTLVVRNELADVFRAQLRYTEAEKLARGTLRQLEGALSSDDPRLLRAWTNWAKLLSETPPTRGSGQGHRTNRAAHRSRNQRDRKAPL